MMRRSRNSDFLTAEELEEYGIQNAKERNILIHSTCVIVNFDAISIGRNVRIDPFVVLSCSDLVIGSYVHIATGCCIIGKERIKFGDFSTASAKSLVYSSNDDYSGKSLISPTVPVQFTNVTSAPVEFCRYSIVGARCTVLPGVTLGEGAAAGSGSFINKDLPAWTISVGVPAKPIKARDRGCIAKEAELRATLA